MNNDYMKYRGKCKEYCEKLLEERPELTLVRGYFHDPFEGKLAHWWLKDSSGKIIDPTVRQFTSKGIGAIYKEFDGIVICEECGKSITEEEIVFSGRFAVCSHKCNMILRGLGEYI